MRAPRGYRQNLFWGANRTFSRAGNRDGCSNNVCKDHWAPPLHHCSSGLHVWPSTWGGWGGLLTYSVEIWQSSQRGTIWYRHDFEPPLTPQKEFVKVASHAFSFCVSLYGNKVILFFPPGSHCVTEIHLLWWHWQCGFERKIPVLSGMLHCWVPESENILPAVNVRKTKQPRLKCQVVFWKADSPENKEYWYPAKRAGRNRPWATHWSFGGACDLVCLFVSASDSCDKRWAAQNVRKRVTHW